MSDNNNPGGRLMLIDRIRALSEDKWKRVQTVAGIVMGLGVAACLFFIPESEGFLPINFLAGAALAMFVPRYIESRTERRFDRGRTVLLIMFAACLVGYLVFVLTTRGVDSFIVKKEEAPAATPLPIETPLPETPAETVFPA